MNLQVDDNAGPIWSAFCDWYLSEVIGAELCPGPKLAHSANYDMTKGCKWCGAVL